MFFEEVLSFLFLFVRVSSLHFSWSSQQAELDLKSFIWKRGHNNDDAFNPRFTWAHKEMEFKWTRLILKPEENLFHLNKKQFTYYNKQLQRSWLRISSRSADLIPSLDFYSYEFAFYKSFCLSWSPLYLCLLSILAFCERTLQVSNPQNPLPLPQRLKITKCKNIFVWRYRQLCHFL